MAELVEPLDRALRSTRVLVRQCAVAAYRRQEIPHSYAVVAAELAAAVEVVAIELDADRLATAAQPALLAVGAATGQLERSDDLSSEVVLAQLRVDDRRPAAADRDGPARGDRRAAPGETTTGETDR